MNYVLAMLSVDVWLVCHECILRMNSKLLGFYIFYFFEDCGYQNKEMHNVKRWIKCAPFLIIWTQPSLKQHHMHCQKSLSDSLYLIISSQTASAVCSSFTLIPHPSGQPQPFNPLIAQLERAESARQLMWSPPHAVAGWLLATFSTVLGHAGKPPQSPYPPRPSAPCDGDGNTLGGIPNIPWLVAHAVVLELCFYRRWCWCYDWEGKVRSSVDLRVRCPASRMLSPDLETDTTAEDTLASSPNEEEDTPMSLDVREEVRL